MKLPINYEKSHWTIRKAAREQYVKEQKGKCCHCGRGLHGPAPRSITKKRIDMRLFPANFFRYNVHLHHNHRTGMTIGAVHATCNAVLFQYHGE